jgi:MFS family permease
MSAGIPGQRFGRRDSLRAMAVFYVVSALGCAFAWNWPALIVFRFIGGVGIGGSSVLGPMYIAEIAPAEWRGRLVGFFQVNIVVGILLAYISNFLLGSLHLGVHEWRWQLGISAVPAILFLIALFGIPRSPRWLATQAKVGEALDVLRLTGIPRPKEELEEDRRFHLSGAVRRGRTGVLQKISQAGDPGGYGGNVLPAFWHQRNSLLPEQYFRACWGFKNFGRPAGSCGRRNGSGSDFAGNGGH